MGNDIRVCGLQRSNFWYRAIPSGKRFEANERAVEDAGEKGLIEGKVVGWWAIQLYYRFVEISQNQIWIILNWNNDGKFTGSSDLKATVTGAFFLQECIPERLDMKQKLYEQLDGLIDDEIIVSSSTSTFMPSLFATSMKHRNQVLVSHPVNPPYYVPLVEIVPSKFTKPDFCTRTRDLWVF